MIRIFDCIDTTLQLNYCSVKNERTSCPTWMFENAFVDGVIYTTVTLAKLGILWNMCIKTKTKQNVKL